MEDNEKKGRDDLSYSEYYKIKSNIELHKQHLQKELDKLNKLAKGGNVTSPDIVDDSGSKRQRVVEVGIMVIIFVVVFGIIGYVSLAGLFPDLLPFGVTGYSIMADDSKLLSVGEFYVEDASVLGDKMTYEGRTIRPITSSKKFNLVFKPARTIKPTTGTLTLNLVMLNNSNIYLNDKLMFPNLDGYEILEETYDGYYVYAKKDIFNDINTEEMIEGDTVSEFLYYNFPSSSVWSTSELDPVNPVVDGYKQEWTEINTTFRGDLHLAVYAEGSLNIKFTKQDLNGYLGADEYIVNVSDSGGAVVYSALFQDEGVKEAGKGRGEEQPFQVSLDSLEGGVYYVDFFSDSNNQYSDVSVKNIQVNSNKIIFVGNTLPISPFVFFTKAGVDESVGFNYWHTGKNQLITITGVSSGVIDLNESWISTTYNLNLSKGEYNIGLQKGDVWVYADVISPGESSYFDLPPIISSEFNNQDFLVIDSYTYDHYNKVLYVEKDVEVSGGEKFGLRALEPGAVGVESVNLGLG